LKRQYEGMFVLRKSLADEELDKVLEMIQEEIEKVGGEVQSTTRLGKRSFAYSMKKESAGFYAVVMFELDGDAVDALRARFKLNTDVLRVQIVLPADVTDAAPEQQEVDTPDEQTVEEE